MNHLKHAHYFKEWSGKIDIYRLLDLFQTKRRPIDHAIKKLICAGGRGQKSELKDYQEAIDSINRCIEMIKEDEVASIAKAVENAKREFSRIDIIATNGPTGEHYAEIKPYQDDFEE
jgi:hypothetical protein